MSDAHPGPPPTRVGHRRARPRRIAQPPTPGAYLAIDVAAQLLDLDREALRTRCRRGTLLPGGQVDLGGGITAIKFGRTWRVRLPNP